ncbi:MAG TPA: DegT/DnrJ/EryC1/StrS family aminotransferase [bacterium]|nr:DegT/DnrJ/EryC1/StrS family aminotransferase [bacterium]
MYVSTWPGLHLRNAAGARTRAPFPLADADGGIYFYRARGALYYLFQRLAPGGVVLVPDYHHGNEVAAIRAAGAKVRFYPVDRQMRPDLEALRRLAADGASALLVIQYLGWPAPMREILPIAKSHGLTLVEDCALSLLSCDGEIPLGSMGDYSVFCLYKTLPVPNGGLLHGNAGAPVLPHCGPLSVTARVAELSIESLRGRREWLGASLAGLKRLAGRSFTAVGVSRAPIGDSGFNVEQAKLGMSPMCHRLLARFDFAEIVRKRRANFEHLRDALEGSVTALFHELPPGVCPLFFPIFVADKGGAARRLHERGIGAVEFWNEGDPEAYREGSDAAFLRHHVLELPVHQDVSPEQIDFIAREARGLEAP